MGSLAALGILFAVIELLEGRKDHVRILVSLEIGLDHIHEDHHVLHILSGMDSVLVVIEIRNKEADTFDVVCLLSVRYISCTIGEDEDDGLILVCLR